jgi:anti-sigma factor RsiW
MKRRGAFDEKELLSGYLDGELSVEQRLAVEQRLVEDPEFRERYRSLAGLGERLRTLRRHRLDNKAAARLARAIEQACAAAQQDASALDADAERIAAYVDGQLDAQQQQSVRLRLEQDEAQRRWFDRLCTLQRRLKLLTVHRLDDQFAARVLQQIESLAPGSSDATACGEVTPVFGQNRSTKAADRSASHRHAGAWRGVFWAVAAIATAILLMVTLPPTTEPIGQAVVERREGIVERPGVDQPIEAPEDAPVDALAAPARTWSPDASSPFTLVSSLQQRRLVLVYEVLVTEEGVQHAAFSKLLLRHGIGFADTSVISRREQENLLEERFLQDVQIADQRRRKMDRVDLYLVRTTASTADALYWDLMSRPTGFGGFSLNLTTRDAGSQVLDRICESTDVENKVDQAVRLLANLGIMSSSARNLGTFGSIGWIDPALFEIPAPIDDPVVPGRDTDLGDPQAVPPAAEDFGIEAVPPVPVDFECELLFVVRQSGVYPELGGQR